MFVLTVSLYGGVEPCDFACPAFYVFALLVLEVDLVIAIPTFLQRFHVVGFRVLKNGMIGS